VPWRTLRESELLLYYPPFPFTPENLTRLRQIEYIEKNGILDESLLKELSQKRPSSVELVRTMKEYELNSIKHGFSTRPRTKEDALKTLAKRTKDIEEKVIFTRKNLIYSG
jgi:hypothetical protein